MTEKYHEYLKILKMYYSRKHITIKIPQNTHFEHTYSITLVTIWSSPGSSLLWVSLVVLSGLHQCFEPSKYLLLMVTLTLWKSQELHSARSSEYSGWRTHGNVFRRSAFLLDDIWHQHSLYFLSYLMRALMKEDLENRTASEGGKNGVWRKEESFEGSKWQYVLYHKFLKFTVF